MSEIISFNSEAESTLALGLCPQLGASVGPWYVSAWKTKVEKPSLLIISPHVSADTAHKRSLTQNTDLLSKPVLSPASLTFWLPSVMALSLLSFTDKLLQRLSSPCLHFFPSQSSFTIQHTVMCILFLQHTQNVLLRSPLGSTLLNPIDALLFILADFLAIFNFHDPTLSYFSFYNVDHLQKSSLIFLSSP